MIYQVIREPIEKPGTAQSAACLLLGAASAVRQSETLYASNGIPSNLHTNSCEII